MIYFIHGEISAIICTYMCKEKEHIYICTTCLNLVSIETFLRKVIVDRYLGFVYHLVFIDVGFMCRVILGVYMLTREKNFGKVIVDHYPGLPLWQLTQI